MRIVALGMSLLTLVLSIGLYMWFDNDTAACSSSSGVSWIPAFECLGTTSASMASQRRLFC